MNEIALQEHASPKARAMRLKRLRHMLGVTTIGLAKLLKYTRQTVSYWENAEEEGGLSEKGAIKIAKVAREQGILCDAQWLLFGLGEPRMASSILAVDPEIENNAFIKSPVWIESSADKLQSRLRFFKEIESFMLSSDRAVIAEITDTGMEPAYKKGDWVGGHLTTVGTQLAGEICIIEKDMNVEVRMVQVADLEGKFNISYLQKTIETQVNFEVKNVSLPSAAFITRVWRWY